MLAAERQVGQKALRKSFSEASQNWHGLCIVSFSPGGAPMKGGAKRDVLTTRSIRNERSL